MAPNKLTASLLNLGHALDHMFLLIFATSIAAIAADFGIERWEDLMPYGAGAFLMFGLGSVPAGRLGDLWGRRAMMLVFFAGMGCSAMLAAITQNALQLGVVLTVLGLFSAIYHPVGIPMLVQHARRPGATLGISGLAGNLGIALAALVTGVLVKLGGWRMAFFVPGLVSLLIGFVFMRVVPVETEAPHKRKPMQRAAPREILMRVFFVVTATAITGSLLFNFTTNGNMELLRERFAGIVSDPVSLGLLLAAIYTVGAFSQVIVGRLIDHYPLKPLFLGIALFQAPLFLLAANAQGWVFFLVAMAYMVSIFGVIPFTDALIVRYVDDRMRSRVAGMRLAVSFGISSIAVWLLGPFVKASGFSTLLLTMSAIAVLTCMFVTLLPGSDRVSDATLV
ncbi:MAG: MFS transporter [Pseudomonadales bacterium]